MFIFLKKCIILSDFQPFQCNIIFKIIYFIICVLYRKEIMLLVIYIIFFCEREGIIYSIEYIDYRDALSLVNKKMPRSIIIKFLLNKNVVGLDPQI